MESRKLIKFGNSSYVVSLPTSWLKKNLLNKGDTLYLRENGNNELLVTSSLKEKKELKKITIDIKNKPLATIKREIINAYINSYNVIRVVGGLQKDRPEIEKTINGLLALEIMEEKPEELLVKDFLNIRDFSIDKAIRRMDAVIRVMFGDVLDLNNNHYEKLNQLDKTVNKLRFLVYRVLNRALGEPEVAKFLNMGNMAILNSWLLATALETVADQCKTIENLLRGINKKDLQGVLGDSFFKHALELKESYCEIMGAYYNKNKELAHRIATLREEGVSLCEDYLNKIEDKRSALLIEKLKILELFVKKIARLVIDKDGTC